jgi:hypothetical protein
VLLGRLALYGSRAERLHEVVVPVTARWVDPSLRKEPLQSYAREAETKTLNLLEEALNQDAHEPLGAIQERLLAAAAQDVAELLPQLEPRATEVAEKAIGELKARGDREAKDLRENLERQRSRVEQQLAKQERKDQKQLVLSFDDDHKRQLEADIKSWRLRLEQFEDDLVNEPDRIREFYVVKAQRVEPVGLVYLWPETN